MLRHGHFRRVVGSLSWTLAGEVMFAAGQFGLLVVMARMGSEEALGRYALGVTVATPLFIITSLYLRPTYVVARDESFTFGDYFGLRLLGVGLALVAAIVWAAAAGHPWPTQAMIAFVALIRLGELVADMCHAAAGRAEQLRRVGIGRALRGVLLVAVVAGALALGASPVAAVGYGAVAGLVLTVTYDLRTARAFADIRPRFDPSRMVALAKLAAPLGLAGGLLALAQNAPAYVLERVDGLVELGRYTAVISVIYISGVLNLAMGGAAVPRFARLCETDRPAFVRLLLRIVLIIALLNGCVLLGCVLLGRVYLQVAYGPAFTAFQTELSWAGGIAIAAGVANLLSQTVVAMRRFTLHLAIQASSFVAAVVLAVVLIPAHGLLGGLAALGAAIGLRLVVYAGAIAVLTRDRGPR